MDVVIFSAVAAVIASLAYRLGRRHGWADGVAAGMIRTHTPTDLLEVEGEW